MDTRRTRLPKGESPSRRNAEERPWRGYARCLVSLVLLLTFLHSVFLSAAPCRDATPAARATAVRAAHDADAPADSPVDAGTEPRESAPDEEGDSGENAEPDKDFLADEATTPRFSRLLLKQLGYGEPRTGRFCSPLPGFSPPPERAC
jgi:hypothetical protein